MPVIIAVGNIKQFIDNNPTTGITAASLAASAGISRNTLQEVFKEKYGTDISDYKLQLRMQAAQQYLGQGWSVKQVALELHYASSSSFINAFSKFFGKTPRGRVPVKPA